MSIIIVPKKNIDRESLKSQIVDSIANSDTWTVGNKRGITHSPDQWRNLASFNFDDTNPMRLYLSWPKKSGMNPELYAVYHGRFAEYLLSHFGDAIKNIEIHNTL